MLGIIKNENLYNWYNTVSKMLPSDLLLTFTFGYFVIRNFKIKKVSVHWPACLVHSGTDLIVILSFGYFRTNWVVRYWNARCR